MGTSRSYVPLAWMQLSTIGVQGRCYYTYLCKKNYRFKHTCNDDNERVIANLRPPRPNPNLHRKIQDLTSTFKSKLTETVQQHLKNTGNLASRKLEEIDSTDTGLAREIVTKQYKRRLGARARQTTISTAFEELDE